MLRIRMESGVLERQDEILSNLGVALLMSIRHSDFTTEYTFLSIRRGIRQPRILLTTGDFEMITVGCDSRPLEG